MVLRESERKKVKRIKCLFPLEYDIFIYLTGILTGSFTEVYRPSPINHSKIAEKSLWYFGKWQSDTLPIWDFKPGNNTNTQIYEDISYITMKLMAVSSETILSQTAFLLRKWKVL